MANDPSTIPADRFPTYWIRALDPMLEAYQRICAFAGVYIEAGAGTPSIDHMIPKSRAWDQVHEWANDRLACQLINTCKADCTTIVDPFTVADGWFELELATFQVCVTTFFPPRERSKLKETLALLNHSDFIILRKTYANSYWKKLIQYAYLRELRRKKTP